MAPKKKDGGGDVLQDGPPEEEEAGDGKVVLNFSAQGVKDLPGELQTLVSFTGFCKEFRTNASAETSGWEFTKDTVIRLQNQDLYNDLVARPLVVSLRDASAENAVVGSAEISLVPLLHDQMEVSVDLELKLTPDYYAKWWKDDEADDPKKKDKNKAPADPTKEREPLFEGDAPPATILTVSVKVQDLVGPPEDRECWTILTLGMEGVFALPETLTSLGVTSPDDFQAHPMTYKAMLLGESFGEGLLTKAPEEKPPPAEEAVEAPEVTEEEWQSEQMRYRCAVKFASERLVLYRGKSFIEDVRKMLSTSGGVYLYFQLEEKPPADPKKPNPPQTADLARQCSGTAWLDLRSLIPPGARHSSGVCFLEGDVKDAAELESARCFTRLSLELSYDVTPPESLDMKVHPSKLLTHSEGIQPFSASDGASVMYLEVIQRSCEAILRDCQGMGSLEEAVKQMKEVGSYDEVKQNLRESMITIFRERLRKDTAAVPGKPLKGPLRDDFISSTYSFLQLTAAKVLDRQMRPDATGELAEGLVVAKKEAARFSRLAYEAELLGNWTRAAHLYQNRFLIAGSIREDPMEWLNFAKFLGRCRNRQAAAEEALCQAAKLMGTGKEVSKETALEVELYMACLVLDRGRYEEAIAIFEGKHKEDFANPTIRFYLGLALFLRCRWEESRVYLESAGKPREWFQGLPDEPAVVDKLKAFRRSDPVNVHIFADYLEQLLSFGLSSLVFTFLDQTEILPEEVLNMEPVVLVDAKASSLDRNYHAAVTRLQPLLAAGASHQAWMLAGECYLQMQDFDKALQALQMAVSDNKLEDPALYIRLGSVLLVKKRWKQARDTFLRSIQFKPTAEAWSGVAYAELRSDALESSYEALCEANFLDHERCDVWALLCLVHLRTENWDAADQACRQCLSLNPQCDDLLVEVAMEFHRKDRQPSLAEACTRTALSVKDTGQGHGVLADVLAQMGKAEASVLEAQTALKMLVEQPDLRKAIFGKALKICQDLDDKPLTEALHACQKLAEEQYTGRKTPPLGQ